MARWFRPDPHYRADSKCIKMEENKLTIYPRGLDITWGNDKRYWTLPSPDKKEEDNFADLKQVSWLEVTGSTTENLEKEKWYKVGFNVSLRPDAFGWDECNVYIMAKIGKKGEFSYKKVDLNEKSRAIRINIPEDEFKIQALNESSDDLKLYFGMYEVWSKGWKGGLRIHHAFVEKCKPPNK